MTEWPRIDEPELVERLSMDDDEFGAFVETLIETFPRREFEAAVLERALGYPWARPDGAFRLAGDVVDQLGDMAEEEREVLIEEFAADPGRQPVLAIGSNGSPDALQRKFAHFPDAEDRTVLVLTGWLQDFDVGVSAQHTFYGPLPATIFASPGTAMRAALVWVTANQFTQLAWSELSYRLGKLRARFDVDGAEEQFDEVLVFVSRFGALDLGNGPIAHEAVPARGRTAEALTQEAILDAAAELILGPGADAEALLRAAYDDFGATARKAAGPMGDRSIPFVSDRWTPFGRKATT